MYVINIHGLIGEDEGDGEKYFTVANLASELTKAKDAESLMLDIASLGGNTHDGETMEGMIKAANKPIHSRNSGHIASAVTRLFLLGDSKEVRTYSPSKGVFLIHNPHLDIKGAESSHLKAASEYVKKIETNYVNFYNEKTGVDKTILTALMNKDKPLTFEQVDTLGFATIKHEIKAVATNKYSNKQKSNNMSIDKKMAEDIGAIAKGIEMLKGVWKTKAEFTLNDVNGVALVFPEIASGDEIAEGVTVTVNGAPANGDYTLEDGRTIVAEAGKVTAINEAEEEDSEAVLKAEIEALKAENAELKASAEVVAKEHSAVIAEAKAKVDKIEIDFKAIQSKFTTGQPPVNAKTPDQVTTSKKKFSYKRK